MINGIHKAPPDGRLKRFYIRPFDVVGCLNGDFVALNLPADATACAVHGAEAHRAGGLWLTIHSASFEEVSIGNLLPEGVMEFRVIDRSDMVDALDN